MIKKSIIIRYITMNWLSVILNVSQFASNPEWPMKAIVWTFPALSGTQTSVGSDCSPPPPAEHTRVFCSLSPSAVWPYPSLSVNTNTHLLVWTTSQTHICKSPGLHHKHTPVSPLDSTQTYTCKSPGLHHKHTPVSPLDYITNIHLLVPWTTSQTHTC